MTISADNVKAMAYGVAGIAAIYMIWVAYSKLKKAGETFANIPDTVAKVGKQVIQDGQQAYQDAKSALGMDYTSPGYAMPETTKELPINSASDKIKRFIRDIKLARGILVQNIPADFIGWHLYSDGTIISPAGEYFQISSAEAELAPDQYAIREVWWGGKGLDPSLNGTTNWDILAPKEQWQTQ